MDIWKADLSSKLVLTTLLEYLDILSPVATKFKISEKVSQLQVSLALGTWLPNTSSAHV